MIEHCKDIAQTRSIGGGLFNFSDMINTILNWIAKRSPLLREANSLIWTAENASRKLQQGYRERYIEPRSELDELIRNRDRMHKFLNESRK